MIRQLLPPWLPVAEGPFYAFAQTDRFNALSSRRRLRPFEVIELESLRRELKVLRPERGPE